MLGRVFICSWHVVCVKGLWIKEEPDLIDKMMKTAAAMQSRIMKQEIIANNLANVNTTGFKRDRIFQDMLDEENLDLATELRPTTVFEQSVLRETKNLTDVALQGKGFFVVETPEGQRYTRNGHFQRNAAGELVTDKGYPVLGKNGPIGGRGALAISEQGEVYFGETVTDQLQVIEVPENVALRKVGDGLFTVEKAEDAGLERESEQYIVKQGYVEDSNVNAIEEMVRMMTVYRHFEADQKTMRTQDEILSRAVNDIGKF